MDWKKLRAEYIAGGTSYRKLAEKHNVSFHTLRKQAAKEITVTYNGAGKFPGHFKKSITIRTNAKQEIVRLYIEGDMQGGK